MKSIANNIEIKDSNNSVTIYGIELKKSLLNLRALSHNLRLQLLQVIAEQETITVTDLFLALKLEQSVVSQHLATLRRAGYVKTVRNGKYISYQVNYERLAKVTDLIKQMN